MATWTTKQPNKNPNHNILVVVSILGSHSPRKLLQLPKQTHTSPKPHKVPRCQGAICKISKFTRICLGFGHHKFWSSWNLFSKFPIHFGGESFWVIVIWASRWTVAHTQVKKAAEFLTFAFLQAFFLRRNESTQFLSSFAHPQDVNSVDWRQMPSLHCSWHHPHLHVKCGRCQRGNGRPLQVCAKHGLFWSMP